MGSAQKEQRRRYEPGEVIVSEITKDDLISVAEGYHAAFSTEWFDMIEPKSIRPNETIRNQRFATRLSAWIQEPHTRWTKATLHPSSPDYDPSAPDRVIGHAGWLLPGRTATEIMNFWRRDAGDVLGWRDKMGWTESFDEELWSGVDVKAYHERNVLLWDRVREQHLGGIGHWFLAPLWILPAHQGRGVASLLLRDAIELADSDGQAQTMYLEAFPDARHIYERFGFQGIEGDDVAMIRNPPKSVKVQSK